MIIKREIDNSYIIQKNGHPYHVPNQGEWAPQWVEINKYASEHPDEVMIEPAPPEPTLEELKELKCAAIRAESDRRITIIQEGYSQGEIKTFEQQHKGALDILSGDETTQEAQFVIALLNGRLGKEPAAEEKAAFATQICTNYSNAAAATAVIVGEQQRLELEARSATTKEELQAIEWSDEN